MPRKTTAHAELDQLRKTVATERIRARDVDAEIEAAKQRVEDISGDLTEAFADDDTKLVQQRRQELQAAEAEVKDLAHRSKAAGLRVERSQRAVANFASERAQDLLDERAPAAREVALQLTRAGHELVRAHHAFTAMRVEIDALVAATPNAVVRSDGPPAAHAWEPQLRDLERAIRETSAVEPPLPRWAGVEQRQQRDQTNRLLQLRRRKKLTGAEQDELEQLSQDRVVTPNWPC
jgi:hypothetical protein